VKNLFLIDLDETVLDFRRTEREAIIGLLSDYGIEATSELQARYHVINDSFWKRLERGEITRSQLAVGRFEQFARENGFDFSPEEASERFYRYVARGGFWLDGAEAFVRELKRRGRIFLVTNGATFTQTNRIAVSGIDRYAEGTFISEQIGLYKPSEAYARYVEEHIPDYERVHAVWIGDSLTSDAPCARSRGIDFILYRPKGGADGYEGIVAQSYKEILSILDRM